MGRFVERAVWADRSNYTQAWRDKDDIYLIMLHSTEGSEESALNWFKNPASNASSHVVISETGRITHCVSPEDISWTNGNWSVNMAALNIEFVGYAAKEWTWDNQFEAAADLMARWSVRFDLSLNLVGNPLAGRRPLPYGVAAHMQVLGSDHTDPGRLFPYERLSNRAKDIRKKLIRP